MTNDGKRGATVAENGNGTLERVDGTNTYIGTATLASGKVLTKRFRGEPSCEADVIERWEKWQGRNDDGEEVGVIAEAKATKGRTCPLSCQECAASCPLWSAANGACAIMLGGVALYNMSVNMSRLDMSEPLELLAMAVADSGGSGRPKVAEVTEKTDAQGVDAYMEGKTFISFVNLHSKTAYSPYKRFCEENGYPCKRESEFTKDVLARFGELHAEKAHGGVRFAA